MAVFDINKAVFVFTCPLIFVFIFSSYVTSIL